MTMEPSLMGLEEAFPDGYTMTELGPLPGEWRVVRLGEAFEIFAGGDISKLNWSPVKTGQFIYPIYSNSLENNGLYGYADTYKFPKNSITVTGRGNLGHAIPRYEKFNAIIRLLVLVPRSREIDVKFVAEYINARIRINLEGSSIPQLTRPKIASYSIPLPPLPEQRAIAHVLRAVQEAKEATEQVIAAMRELKKSLMRHLFTYGPVPADQTDRVAMQETEIGPLPAHWRVLKLGDVAAIRYGLGQPPELDESGIPMIRATNIKRGRIVDEGLMRVKKTSIPVNRNPFLKAGDIIVVRSGAYTGDVALVPPKWVGAVGGYDLIVSPSEKLVPPFCAQYLLAGKAQTYFRGQRDRSAQPHLNAQQLRATLIPLPPLPEQREIARMLQAVDEKIRAEEERKAALEALFKTLLHDLMTARRRLPEEFVARFEQEEVVP